MMIIMIMMLISMQQRDFELNSKSLRNSSQKTKHNHIRSSKPNHKPQPTFSNHSANPQLNNEFQKSQIYRSK